MSEALSIHHDQAGHQFETNVDGHRAYLTYMDLGKQTLESYRTCVPNALRGRGIAAALTEEDGALLGHIFAVIAKLAAEQGLNNGYRVISNVGEDAGQTVKHLHFHVLGGEKLPV